MTFVVIGEKLEGKFTGPVYGSGKFVSLNKITENCPCWQNTTASYNECRSSLLKRLTY